MCFCQAVPRHLGKYADGEQAGFPSSKPVVQHSHQGRIDGSRQLEAPSPPPPRKLCGLSIIVKHLLPMSLKHSPTSAPLSSQGLRGPSPPSNLPGGRKQEEPHFKLNLFFFPRAPSSHFSLESLVKPLSGISHLLHSGPHTFPTGGPHPSPGV